MRCPGRNLVLVECAVCVAYPASQWKCHTVKYFQVVPGFCLRGMKGLFVPTPPNGVEEAVVLARVRVAFFN